MFRKSESRKKEKAAKAAPIMDNIIRAGSLLTRDMNYKNMISVLVEQSLDVTRSNLSVFYTYSDGSVPGEKISQIYKRGRWETAEYLSRKSSLIEFIEESRESVIVLKKSENKMFPEIFLNDAMKSAIALPIFTPDYQMGILILNSMQNNFYNKSRFQFLDSFSKMAAGMLNNARLFSDMKESYKKIESLERYQQGIFSSMTDLLLTLDSAGKLYYANSEAIRSFGLIESSYGKHYKDLFQKTMSKAILKSIGETADKSSRFLGLEGIYKDREALREIDFKLNLSPLVGVRGKKLGTILIFTDQSKEQELMKQMTLVTEDRRKIKNMFAKYLSKDLVNMLTDQPDLVKPGGDRKDATVLFADICGYTSFSEGQDPAYIVEVLNEFFNEAVEKVIDSKGYIDKYIGDCIMAAWGVPVGSMENDDAVNAVTCALDIQKLIVSKERHFFTGKAQNLKVAIGMHTGSLVAGNLGSSSRMDYTMIGDTVNVAARLEGVAQAGEVIITQSTRDKLSDFFDLEKRTPVKVKGKAKPIQIYNVLDRIK
jgi:adenylate cyclase